MILAIDIGNTNLILGVIEDRSILSVVRLHTEPANTAAEYGIKLRQALEYCGVDAASVPGAIISSVVPPVTDTIREAVPHLTGQESLVVGPGIKTGMNVRIDDPGSLAADLATDSVAAIACYGVPAIILDMGTATSIVVVDEKSGYRGGAIMPGLGLGLKALSEGTSLLPDISVTAPPSVIGRNTVDAMRSGAVYATASMIDGMIDRFESELGYPCRVIATGIHAPTVTAYCRHSIICDENLLLKGLWVLYSKNTGGRTK